MCKKTFTEHLRLTKINKKKSRHQHKQLAPRGDSSDTQWITQWITTKR